MVYIFWYPVLAFFSDLASVESFFVMGTLLEPLRQLTRKDCQVSRYFSGGQNVHRLPQCVLVSTEAPAGGVLKLPDLPVSVPLVLITCFRLPRV